MRFLIVTPCRNTSETIAKTIKSVTVQSHQSWRMIIIDDDSTDGTFDVASKASRGDKRISVIKNEDRKYALKNTLEAIWRYGREDDIIVSLDGDDILSDDVSLSWIAAEYKRTGADAIWTRHQHTDGTMGISREMHGDPLTCGWTMSHLRTFKKSIIHGIRPSFWIDPATGDYWRCAYDQALYRAVLYLAKKPVHFPRVCCTYKQGTPGNHDNQIATAQRIATSLQDEFKDNSPKRVVFIVNGQCKDSDPRFHQGEVRPPLGPLSMAAVLKARGHTVDLVDRYAVRGAWDKKAIAKADVIGVTVTTPNHMDAIDVLTKLQRYRPSKSIIAGGPHAILHPEQLEPLCDMIAMGEADFEIIDMVERGTVSGERIRVDNLDALPLPDYGLAYAAAKYTDGWDYTDATGIINMNTSRSCPFACTFCDVAKIFGRKWIARSAERVVNDIEDVIVSCSAGGIYFREDNFCSDVRRLKDICNLIIDRGIIIPWACEIRADVAAKKDVAELMAFAGCVGWYIGAESGSDKMLKIYRKGITSDQIKAACVNAYQSGINAILSIITDHPEETDIDSQATESMIAECQPHRVYRCKYREC